MAGLSLANRHLIPKADEDVMVTYALSLNRHFQTSRGLTMRHFSSSLLHFYFFSVVCPVRSSQISSPSPLACLCFLFDFFLPLPTSLPHLLFLLLPFCLLHCCTSVRSHANNSPLLFIFPPSSPSSYSLFWQ